MSSRLIEVLGIQTFLVECGSGQPVLLIHGGAPGNCALVNWKPTIEPLAAAGFRVFAYDQPGFGKSTVPIDHSLEFRVQHALALFDKLGLASPHIVANSQGSYIGARIALERAAVQNVVLVSSATLAPAGSAQSRSAAERHQNELNSYQPSFEAMLAMTKRTLFNQELVTQELVAERYAMSTGHLHEANLRRAEAPGAMPINDRMSEIQNKVLLIWGDRDAGVTIERGLLLFQALPNAELHLFHNSAHWPQFDQAERFNSLVAGFLQS